MSKATKAIWRSGVAGVAGLLAAIFVKKTLDSKRNIDSEQDNNNKNSKDSEPNEEIKKIRMIKK